MRDRRLLDNIEGLLTIQGTAFEAIRQPDGSRSLRLLQPRHLSLPATCYLKVSRGWLVLFARFADPRSGDALDLRSPQTRDDVGAYAAGISPALAVAKVAVQDDELRATASAPLSGDLWKIVIGGTLGFQMDCARIACGLALLLAGRSVDESVALAKRTSGPHAGKT